MISNHFGANTIRLARVCYVHPEGQKMEVIFLDNGDFGRDVQLSSPMAGTDFGFTSGVVMPEEEGHDENMVDSPDRRSITCVVATLQGLHVCLGFLYPQITQLAFDKKKHKDRLIERHPSDFYRTMSSNADADWVHPSGAYMRVGEGDEPDALDAEDFDQRWKLKHNLSRDVNITLQNFDSIVQLDFEQNITAHAPRNIEMDADVDWSSLARRDLSTESERNTAVTVGQDFSEDVVRDSRVTIGHDSLFEVGNNSSETVGNDRTVNIGNNSSETVGNDASLDAGRDRSVIAARNYAMEAAEDVSLKSGSAMTIESGDALSVTVVSDASLNADGVVVVDSAQRVHVKAPTEIKLEAPIVRITGALVLEGGSVQSAGNLMFQIGGSATIDAGGAVTLGSAAQVVSRAPSVLEDTATHHTTGVHTDANGRHN